MCQARSNNLALQISRRWEDCMWFVARLKRIYLHRQRTLALPHDDKHTSSANWMSAQQAYSASFSSLFPRVPQGASIFRDSISTANDRQRQFQAFVNVLFSDVTPDDLRTSWVVSHFFSYWRLDRDHDRRHTSYPPNTNGAASQTVLHSSFCIQQDSPLPALWCPTSMQDNHSISDQLDAKSKRGGTLSNRSMHCVLSS